MIAYETTGISTDANVPANAAAPVATFVATHADAPLAMPATEPAAMPAAAPAAEPDAVLSAEPDAKRVLYVDACIARESSRTERLAQAYLQKLRDRNSKNAERPLKIETLVLAEAHIGPLTEEQCARRMAFSKARTFDDAMFLPAKQFKAADLVVLAAPYWDLSFPSIVKNYIEQLSVDGLTFIFNEKGEYVPQCKAEKLVYITTAGGYIDTYNYGFEYVSGVFKRFFGIVHTEFFAAEALDVIGTNIEAALQQVIERM